MYVALKLGLTRLTCVYNVQLVKNTKKICNETKIEPSRKLKDLSEEGLDSVRSVISNYLVEGDLRREISVNIKRLTDLNCYRGVRHKRGLPVRGQRTRTNARTRKGPKKGSSPIKKNN